MAVFSSVTIMLPILAILRITQMYQKLHSNRRQNETAHFFAFSLIIEGATEKVMHIIKPLKSIYNKNLGFIEQKCIFEHSRGSNNEKCIN